MQNPDGKKGVFVRLDGATEAKLRDLAKTNSAKLGDVVAVAIDLLASGSSGSFRAQLETRQARELQLATEADAAKT